ncbi:hypothetical protein ABEB36_013370 [Hypothenemus hampei]|uniref:Uncharacterized protein n=1 Tax=Hypothenemus hampei TaxID=57062 RepID=A0ABD1EC59_HYPHA
MISTKKKKSQSNLNRWIGKDESELQSNKPNISIKRQVNKQTSKEKSISTKSDRGSSSQVQSKKPLRNVISTINSTKVSHNKRKLSDVNSNMVENPFTASKKRSNEKVTKNPKVKCDVSNSDDLPLFRKKLKIHERSESFKKYGVKVPSIDEILDEKNKLVDYKKKVEEALLIEEPSFSVAFTPKKTPKEPLLDCKNLSLPEITTYFTNNISYLSDIIKGIQDSDRHRLYYNKNNETKRSSMKDLTINTSTIVFTFDQLDHILNLMRDEFDPKGTNTQYFFQVLLPELCLKIFMKEHKMTKSRAIKYLDQRPVE